MMEEVGGAREEVGKEEVVEYKYIKVKVQN